MLIEESAVCLVISFHDFLNPLQTQPVPNPMSYFMHQSPEIFHKFETLFNHFIELVVPFFILLTRPFRIWCGILQVLFQVRVRLNFLNVALRWLKTVSFFFNTNS